MGRTNTQLHLENLVGEWVARFPLQEKSPPHAGMVSMEDALKIPCLLWDMGKSDNGYGKIYVGGIQKQAHRWAFEIAYGKAPGIFRVCHHCDRPPCICPHHLFLGTQAQNLDDMRRKGRERKCGPKGSRAAASIFTESDVIQMRRLFASGAKIMALIAQFGGSYQSVWSIVYRQSWKHIIP